MAPKQQPADRYAKSHRAHARAIALMPGGVSSPVRAYKAVGREPVYIQQGKGCRVTDLDGNQYIDYVLSYGPLILGHAPDAVLAAVTKAAQKGTSFGMPAEAESALAALIVDAFPSIDLVRFVNSGTEATMSAIRLARAATGRPKIIKCTGCYHGHSDGLLVQAGSGATTLGVPSSPGVPTGITAHTVLVPYNDLEAVERALAAESGQIAAMIVEPVAGNMGCIPPLEGYLHGLRRLCDQHGALLIFDEVMSGFRVAWGGAQTLYNVRPDLTCLGKVVGGGLPCAAYGGRENLMRQVAPDGPVYQAGTLSGNPLAMAAGIATLEALSDQDAAAYAVLDKAASELALGLHEAAGSAGVLTRPDAPGGSGATGGLSASAPTSGTGGSNPLHITRVGSMLCPFFHPGPIHNYEQALTCDTRAYAAFFNAMLDRGVILPPSQFETWFLSTTHDAAAISQTIEAAREAFRAMR
jgi:glutamate-1-semialdehyde 2,1-aminomutase